jgi:flagellar biosynthetic protein FliO
MIFEVYKVFAKRTVIAGFIILFLGAGYVYPDQQQQDNFGMNLTKKADENSDRQVTGTDLMYRMFWSILIVAGLGIGVVYLSRKVLPKYGTGKGRYIRVLETLSLGSGNRVCLIEIEDKRLLIGSGSNGVSRISELEKDTKTFKETGQIKNGDFQK